MADALYTNIGGMLVAEDRGGVYSNYLSDTLGSVRKIFSGGTSAVLRTRVGEVY